MILRIAILLWVLLTALQASAAPRRDTITVGAKAFTEQEILGELVAQALERGTYLRVERRFGLGGTDLCHQALRTGEIDLYVEYSGTGLLNVLQRRAIQDPDRAFRVVAGQYRERFDLEWLPPIGFNNTYAIAVREADAQANNWVTISDLENAAPDLRAGFTSEFMERPDGRRGLSERYGFAFGAAIDLDPGLMQQAIAIGQVDVIAAFATDGRVDPAEIRLLEDDLRFFPRYDAAPVVRAGLLERHPEVRDALAALAGTIDDRAMRAMNRQVDIHGLSPAQVAERWLDARAGAASESVENDGESEPRRAGYLRLAWERRSEIWNKTIEHFILTALGLVLAITIGVPLGVFVHRQAKTRGLVLAGAEIVQTIPSLAMLAFLFAIYGVLGVAPAVTALVLYALLPIVLNTYTGLREIRPELIQAADSLGMTSWQRLRLVELPLAAPVAIAGVRAAAVLTVGIATLSTYIGAGGYGDFIARGLARNDPRLTLLGAVPAAIMAVTLSLLIRLAERAASRG